MLVICEDCAKKYNIDESKIRGNRARFTCNECGHIIIVDKADLTRSLIHKTEQSPSSSSSVDLLKEMQAPLSKKPDAQPELPEQQSSETSANKNEAKVKKKKELTIPGYFIVAGILSFIVTNGGVGYILSQHYSKIPGKQMELHSDLLLIGAMVLLGAWAVTFLILFVMGVLLSRKVNKLTAQVNQVNQGEKEVDIAVKGPKELVNLAKVLSELSSKIK